MGNKSSTNKKEKFNLTYNNEDRYEGEIFEGKREGFGTYYYHVGDKYIGYWNNNKKHGTGTLFYKDGNLYVGLWRKGEKEGLGSLYLKNGEKYIGEFKNGKKDGRGYLYSHDGTKYVGYFHENKKHGRGVIYHSNGKVSRELWESGVLIQTERIEEVPNIKLGDSPKINNLNSNTTGSTRAFKSNNEMNINEENLNDLSFENYIDEQLKIYSSLTKSKKQAKHFTLEIAKYFKARIPNNYFDTIQLITSASDLIFDKPEIIDWTNDEVVSWINHLGLDKYSRYFFEEKINGVQFIKCNVFDFKKRFKINDQKDLKLLLKSVDFLRIFIKIKKDYQNFLDLEKINNEDNKTKNINNLLSNKHLNRINEEVNETEKPPNDNDNINNNNYNIEGNKENNLIIIDDQLNREENNNISTNRSKKQTDNHSEKNNENDTSNKEVSEDNSYINDNQAFNITKISITKMLIHSLNLSGFNFFINFEDLKFHKKIGEGGYNIIKLGYGEVFSGLWNGKWVAIKKLSLKENHNIKNSLIKFIREINIISSLRHPNIVLYMGATINKNDYYMVSEYINKGSLFDYIHIQKGKISEKDQIIIAYEIAIAIKYLHSRKILHCDLKSSNILIDDNWKIKISDFGLSRIKNFLTLHENKGRIGTPHWMAPEIMKGKMYFEASDVFSYGMILWEIATYEIPYYGLSQYQIVGIVADCKKIVEVPKNINPILWKIIKKCLCYDIKERPSLDLIIKKLEKYINRSESNGKFFLNLDELTDQIYNFVC